MAKRRSKKKGKNRAPARLGAAAKPSRARRHRPQGFAYLIQVQDPNPKKNQGSYKSLNDAARVHAYALAPGRTRIWYTKWIDDRSDPMFEYMRDLRMGADWMKKQGLPLPGPSNIWKSHTKLGSVQSTDPEELFVALQGESWSPRGEARDLIRRLGLAHTSMSVGDIVQLPDGRLMMVDNFGFYEIPQKNRARKNPRVTASRSPARQRRIAAAFLRSV